MKDIDAFELARECVLHSKNISWNVDDMVYVIFKKFGLKTIQYKHMQKEMIKIYAKMLSSEGLASFDSENTRFHLNLDSMKAGLILEEFNKTKKLEKKEVAENGGNE